MLYNTLLLQSQKTSCNIHDNDVSNEVTILNFQQGDLVQL